MSLYNIGQPHVTPPHATPQSTKPSSTAKPSVTTPEVNKSNIPLHEWNKIINNDINSSTINKQCNEIVLNWLTVEGLSDVTQQFISDTHNTTPHTHNTIQSIDVRMNCKKLLLNGDIDGVIELINNIDCAILSNTDNNLSYLLHKQKLIHLIKSDQSVDNILLYAQQCMLQLIQNDTEKLNEVEDIMSLLICNDITQSPYSYYTEQPYLYELSSSVNNILIQYYNTQNNHDNGHPNDNNNSVDNTNELVNTIQQLHYNQQQLLHTHNIPYIQLIDMNNDNKSNGIDLRGHVKLDTSLVDDITNTTHSESTPHGSSSNKKSLFAPATNLLYHSPSAIVSGIRRGLASRLQSAANTDMAQLT